MYARLLTLRLMVLAILTTVGHGYLLYANRIPNGRSVPHPCKPNELWQGVGHFNEDGGGHRNAFGKDFKAAGLRWTEELCRKDSDGDGRSNGEELGDPDCVWEPDAIPTRTKYISHPGVCDPHDSLDCQRKSFNHVLFRTQEEWMADACKSSEFVCDGLDGPDVKNFTLQFPQTAVPAKETTYMCVTFDFPDWSKDVQKIASTPVLDNREVMHHMVLFGCGLNEVNGADVGVPFECDMIPHQNCSGIIALWTIGMNGQCPSNISGYPMRHKKVVLQFHWNNPEKLTTYTDSSALVLHYTQQRRQYESGTMVLGSNHFVIPPGQKRVEVSSIFSSACTARYANKPIYITTATNHMHYLGISQTVEHFRNGTRLRYITNDQLYSYDSPKVHQYDDPIEVLPGDELRTRCNYTSMSRKTTTVYGDSTEQEMCFVFVSFYPRDALFEDKWVTYGSASTCDPISSRGCAPFQFIYHWRSYLHSAVTGNCTVFGKCFEECKAVIAEVKRTEPCMSHEDFWDLIKSIILEENGGTDFLGALASCEPEMAREEALASRPTTCESSEASAVTGRRILVALVLCLPAVIFLLHSQVLF